MTNSKSTKRALISSTLAILMCMAMLIGTTFAWFTDTASTGVNTIKSGNLHVEIQDETDKKIDNLEWVKEDGTVIDKQDDILWEPGCTYLLTPFKIVNTGNLALKYKIVITGLEGDSLLLDVIKFTYKVGGVESKLDEEGHLKVGEATDMITVSAHMDEAAGNKYQDQELKNVKFTVYATQDTVESDSYNNQYDKDATLDFEPVATAAELKAAIADGKNVSLTEDIQLDERIEITNDLFIQGNGKTLTAPDNSDNQRVINLADTTGDHTITLYNVNLEGPTSGAYTRGIAFYNNSGKVKVVMDNCTASANYYAINVAGLNNDIEITVKNSTITGWCAAQTWSANSKLTFENCTLIGINDKGYDQYGDNDFATIVVNTDAVDSVLSFKDCKIISNQTTGNTQYFLLVNANCTVTFDGCTFVKDGVEVSADQVNKNIDGTGFTLTIK